MSRNTVKCPNKGCKYPGGSASELIKHVKEEHRGWKMPKANRGMAHCIWPECEFEHENPGRVAAHIESEHKN